MKCPHCGCINEELNGLAKKNNVNSLDDLKKFWKDVDPDIIEKGFERGKEIELEHTDDEQDTETITLDHMVENPFYYDEKKGLDHMEKKIDKKLKKMDIEKPKLEGKPGKDDEEKNEDEEEIEVKKKKHKDEEDDEEEDDEEEDDEEEDDEEEDDEEEEE